MNQQWRIFYKCPTGLVEDSRQQVVYGAQMVGGFMVSSDHSKVGGCSIFGHGWTNGTWLGWCFLSYVLVLVVWDVHTLLHTLQYYIHYYIYVVLCFSKPSKSQRIPYNTQTIGADQAMGSWNDAQHHYFWISYPSHPWYPKLRSYAD